MNLQVQTINGQKFGAGAGAEGGGGWRAVTGNQPSHKESSVPSGEPPRAFFVVEGYARWGRNSPVELADSVVPGETRRARDGEGRNESMS